MVIEPESKLLMIGDSITDCGRAHPVGEDSPEGGLGNGYANLVHGLLAATYPTHNIRILNMGISGNTVLDLEARWQRDVIDLEPDWLSIMIGINDVWRQFDAPVAPERHVSLETYERTLAGLIDTVHTDLRGLILMTPFFIEPQRSDPMRAMMDRYGDVVRRLAQRYNARLVDTQAAFDRVLQAVHPMQLAADRVHPGTTGHMILARAFLNGIGYEWR